jgi:hypothetical protein
VESDSKILVQMINYDKKNVSTNVQIFTIFITSLTVTN